MIYQIESDRELILKLVNDANVKPIESVLPTGRIFPKYNFTWEEVFAPKDVFAIHEFTQTHRDNVILLAAMLQELRLKIKKPINIESWFRSTPYNNIELPKMGYKSSKTSDHLEGRAADTDLRPFTDYIQKWKVICGMHGVAWSIGNYGTWLHLGYRFTTNREWKG